MSRRQYATKMLAAIGAAWLMALSCGESVYAAQPAAAAQQPIWAPDVFGGYASDHVIIRVQPGVQLVTLADGRLSLRIPAAAAPKNQSKPKKQNRAPKLPIDPALLASSQLAATLARWQTISIKPALSVRAANIALAKQIGLDRYYLVSVPPGTNTPAMATELARFNSLIQHAEVDGVGGVADIDPNDPEYQSQYGPQTIDMPQAWALATGGSDVVLAVLDVGMWQHIDMAGRLIPGWNTASNNDDTSDACNSHGTHVAGIAAATGNNSIGIAGVNWGVQVMPIRVLNSCIGVEATVANGITWAVDHGADVLNMSLQFYAGTQFLHDAVLYADASDVVMCAATGNNGNGVVAFPARWPETIAIAATDSADMHWFLSNFGPEVDVAAPGVVIWSLQGPSSYGNSSGTSMATPHVAGLACMLRSLNPGLTKSQIAELIEATCDDVDMPGIDSNTGHGRINAFRAVFGATHPADVNHDGQVGPADLAQLLAAWGPCDSCAVDFNHDGMVGPFDLAQLLSQWG